MDKMTVERWQNSDTMSNTYPVWTGRGVNTSLRRQRPVIDRPSQGTGRSQSTCILIWTSPLYGQRKDLYYFACMKVTCVKSIPHSGLYEANKTYTIPFFYHLQEWLLVGRGWGDREQVGEHSDELALHPSCTWDACRNRFKPGWLAGYRLRLQTPAHSNPGLSTRPAGHSITQNLPGLVKSLFVLQHNPKLQIETTKHQPSFSPSIIRTLETVSKYVGNRQQTLHCSIIPYIIVLYPPMAFIYVRRQNIHTEVAH